MSMEVIEHDDIRVMLDIGRGSVYIQLNNNLLTYQGSSESSVIFPRHWLAQSVHLQLRIIKRKISLIVEQISWAIFQGGGLWSTTFVSIYQNVRIGL